MEIQFHKTACPYLQQLKRELQYQEQTQEIRLADGMPDIGKVIGAWGQPLIRSKEWRSGGMGVSGGVMAWVLYEPEEGGQPQSVEAWLPFQLKWDLPDAERDGTIHAACLLKSVDARTTSARKLMVRASVGVMGEAFVPGQAQIPEAVQLPDDVQLLKRTYPVCLPAESGERHFELEEEITLQGSIPPVSRLIYYTVQPEITEQKVMASKVVFRGSVLLHVLYASEDGLLHSTNFDFPFSMYSELEKDYDEDAVTWINPIVTGLELDIDPEGKLRMKAGLAGQYVISARQMIQVVEDAYSPSRVVMPNTEQLCLPMILDDYNQTLHAEQTVDVQGKQEVDIAFYPDHPRLLHDVGSAEMEFLGHFQMLYYDEAGTLQSILPRWEETQSIPISENSRIEASVLPTGRPQGSLSGGNAAVRGDILVNSRTVGLQGINVVTGLELGEPLTKDPNRPSLLLRRFDKQSLWDLAKETGTTVEAIQAANRLQEEPAYNKVLLIPMP